MGDNKSDIRAKVSDRAVGPRGADGLRTALVGTEDLPPM